jgi:hypothetical protein
MSPRPLLRPYQEVIVYHRRHKYCWDRNLKTKRPAELGSIAGRIWETKQLARGSQLANFKIRSFTKAPEVCEASLARRYG